MKMELRCKNKKVCKFQKKNKKNKKYNKVRLILNMIKNKTKMKIIIKEINNPQKTKNKLRAGKFYANSHLLILNTVY